MPFSVVWHQRDKALKKQHNRSIIIKSVTKEKMNDPLDFAEKVFTDSECAENGRPVRSLVPEIRSKKYYYPELDLITVNENDEIIGIGV